MTRHWLFLYGLTLAPTLVTDHVEASVVPFESRVEGTEEIARALGAGHLRNSAELLNALREARLDSIDKVVDALGRLPVIERARAERPLAGVARAVVTALNDSRLQALEARSLRALGLSCLENRHEARDVGTLLDLAMERNGHGLDRALFTRTGALLDRLLPLGPAALDELVSRFRELDLALQTLGLRSIGKLESSEALGALLDLLGGEPALDTAILSRVRSLARDVELPSGADPLIPIRIALSSGTPSVQAQAALCLATLGDHQSLNLLVLLHDSGTEEVQRSAHHALRELTGFGFELGSDEWARWLREEERWWRDEAGDAIAKLQGSRVSDQVAAIKALGRKRLRREEVVRQLDGAVRRCAPSAASLAATVIGRLDGRAAAEALLDGLDHADPGVRQACHQSLVRIFGVERPAERRAWADLVRD